MPALRIRPLTTFLLFRHTRNGREILRRSAYVTDTSSVRIDVRSAIALFRKRRSAKPWVVGGAAAGALVWAYDARFFLNAGGAETPIARAILRACHLERADMLVWVLWPPAVLIAAGMVVGLILFCFAGPRRR